MAYKCESTFQTCSTLSISPHLSLRTVVEVLHTLHHGQTKMDSPTQTSGRTSVPRLQNVARVGRVCPPPSGDTVLVSQQSIQTNPTEDHLHTPSRAPSSASSPRGPAASSQAPSTKRSRTARELVDEDHLCSLVAAYNVHFEKYSEGKTNVTQLIPSLVWKHTYATYLEAYPNSRFKPESLKERLRDTLRELKTGNSNDNLSERAALQSRSVMEALRCTDGHAKRNILRKRAKILNATQAPIEVEEDSSDDSHDVRICTPPSDSANKHPAEDFRVQGKKPQHEDNKENHSVGPNLTKAQMLHKQTSSIEKISNTYVKSSVKRDALLDLRIVANEFKHNKNRIDQLKTALEFGLILDNDFKVSANRPLDMWSAIQDDILEPALQIYIYPGEVPGPRFCEPIPWDEVEEYMKQWKALSGPVDE